MLSKIALLNALISAVSAGTILWDGRFNDMTSSADLEKWSFSNPVGSYQYYIHGSGAVTDYVNLDSTFKNPADTASKQGAKITIDQTSKWNGQTMLRTELIPQTSAAINKGKVYYHFSLKTSSTNPPTTANEHQIAFFESHFTELKYGASGSSSTKLHWHVGGASKWDVELVADEWHNVAYEIDFDAGAVSFYHSTGSAALTKTAGPFDASAQSDGKDFHVGVLRLPEAGDKDGAEDWYFSGVYVESGDLTTAVGGGDSAPAPAASAPAASSAAAAPSAAPTSSAAPVPSSVAAETPVASATPVESAAPVASSPAASAAPAPASSAAPAASSAAPAPAPSAPAESSDELPAEFTLKEFIAWLKAKAQKSA